MPWVGMDALVSWTREHSRPELYFPVGHRYFNSLIIWLCKSITFKIYMPFCIFSRDIFPEIVLLTTETKWGLILKKFIISKLEELKMSAVVYFYHGLTSLLVCSTFIYHFGFGCLETNLAMSFHRKKIRLNSYKTYKYLIISYF